MMLVCPGCNIGLVAPIGLPLPAPVSTPTQWLTVGGVGGVQPPYVCGWMFQQEGKGGWLCTPHHHVLCCLPCPHACPTSTLLPVKLPCAAQDTRANCLHTSGGCVVEGQKEGGATTPQNPSPCPFMSLLTPPPQHPTLAPSTNPFLPSLSSATPQTHPSTLAPLKPTIATTPIPATPTPPATSPVDTEDDSVVLAAIRRELEESGWYYGAVTWQEAADLLKNSPVGTFLVRDSYSPLCLYSLSVQTTRGPTSVRLQYSRGKFRLDCRGAGVKVGSGEQQKQKTPEFSTVAALLEHYTTLASSQVWVDHHGNTFSSIDIRKPLLRSPPPLQHLCRLVLNRSSVSPLLLPPALNTFLKEYPHTV